MVLFMKVSELGDVVPRIHNLVGKLRNVSLMHWQPYSLIVKGTEFLLSLYQFIYPVWYDRVYTKNTYAILEVAVEWVY